MDKNLSDETHRLTRAGSKLTPAQAAEFEAALVQNPHDIAIRTQLLGYYFMRSIRNFDASDAQEAHILWLVGHNPETGVLGESYGMIHAGTNTAGYLRVRELWLGHLDAQPQNIAILGNAAAFFTLSDRKLALQTFQSLFRLDPTNPIWPRHISHLLSYVHYVHGEPRASHSSPEALQAAEQAFALESPEGRTAMLDELAKLAFDANEIDKARDYAKQALRVGPEGESYGKNVHHGNLILGRIALQAGDTEEAKTRLLLAGGTPGYCTLNSFGPNMMLAQELLEHGERTAVLSYLELCKTFWKSSRGRLEQWATVINNGEIPDFGANLIY